MYPQPDIEFIPANPANYMLGRSGTPVRHVFFHHIVGSAQSALDRFAGPNQVSAHFIVAPNKIYCSVDTDNTAYSNGVWASNLESVSIEHEGTWLNGYRNEDVMNTSARLVAWLRGLYPDATPMRHRDVYATACPGELPVEEIWNKASELINPPKPVPVAPEWLRNRTVDAKTMYTQVGNVQLWNLDNPTLPADARVFPVNTELKIGSKTTVGGVDFYITEYSTGKNIAAGYKASQLDIKPYKAPEQPPVVTPTPTMEERLTALEKVVQVIRDFLNSIFKTKV